MKHIIIIKHDNKNYKHQNEYLIEEDICKVKIENNKFVFYKNLDNRGLYVKIYEISSKCDTYEEIGRLVIDLVHEDFINANILRAIISYLSSIQYM